MRWQKILASLGSVVLSLEAANYSVTSNSGDPNTSGTLPNIINQINFTTFNAPSTPQDFAISFSPSIPSNTIALINPLPPIVASPFAPITGTIDGSGVPGGLIIDGAATYSAFILIGNSAPGSGQFTISNMTIQNVAALGGPGGTGFVGGGGGGGLGGGVLLLNGANATIQSIAFSNNSAQGGSGGDVVDVELFAGAAGGGGIHGAGGSAGFFSPAGGGGLMGNAGNNVMNFGGSAGGGLIGNGGDSSQGSGGGGGGLIPQVLGGSPDGSTDVSNNQGGDGGGPFGGPGGSDMNPGMDGGLASGGGGGGGVSPGATGGNGGYGGGGGGGSEGANGGNGDFGGGGGASATATLVQGGNAGFGGGGGTGYGNLGPSSGGNGGFGGGGGSGAIDIGGGITSGAGGFGGGSGGAVAYDPSAVAGAAGYGAGTGGAAMNGSASPADPTGTAGGGGGASLGGAVFTQDGSTLTVVDCTFTNNSVTPSAGGTAPFSPGTGGSAFGADFFLMSGGALNFDLTGPLILNNPIEGDQGAGGGNTLSGGLTKSGSGRLELSGVNTYTGITTVQAGELHIDTSVVTDIVVQSGGTLGSTFSILPNTAATNAGSLTNSGRVDPGLGTITISGDFTNNSSGTLAVEITSSGSNGRLFLPTGSSLLSGGILEVFCNSGTYIDGTHYTVINSPVTGTFANLLQTGPMHDRLIIDVAYSSVVLTIRTNPIFNNLVVTSKIAREVAGCIESALPSTPGSDFALMIQTIGSLEPKQINQALIELSPVNYGALEWINERNNNYLADILSEHLFEPSCTQRDYCTENISAWVDVFGNLMNNFKRYNNLGPFEANALGAVTGLDYSSSQNFTMGSALAYTHTWLDWKHHHGNGNINSYYGALYACFRGSVDIDVSAIAGGSDHELKRKIDIQGTNAVTGAPIDIDRVARSNPWGYFFNGRLRFSADREWRGTTFEPFGLIDYNYFNRKGFKEHGANSLDLKVREHTQNMLRGEAGLKAYRTWDWRCSCIEPYLGLSWVGEFPLGKSRQRASFTGQDCVIDVISYHSSAQLVSPQAGVKWMTNNGLSFVLGYKGLYNNKTSINEVEGRLEWVF